MFINKDEFSAMLRNEVMRALREYDEQTKTDHSSNQEVRYLTRKQVAAYLSISLSTVDLWSRTGKLRKVNIKGSVRFDKEEIDAKVSELGKYGKRGDR